MYQKADAQIIEKLKAIVGENYVFLDVENMEKYGSDETEDLQFFPEVIVKPATPTEISQILILANEYHIPVTPQGARTGLSGGALPVYGGIALSMERFNKILFLDERNLQITTEPGVITEVLQNTVIEKGLFTHLTRLVKEVVLLVEMLQKILVDLKQLNMVLLKIMF